MASQYDLHGRSEPGGVHPVFWELVKLVGVDDAEHQHGIHDGHPPEEVDRKTPEPVA